ncbi:AraC family transcriptional regulator [Paenibacillus yanchengensis]|uniref:AraC family transcriptional regulator n=1 Tax=Paenibacillus yanchengensis TaxID=2035833 RepID=A0ABW4YQG8_9BACL
MIAVTSWKKVQGMDWFDTQEEHAELHTIVVVTYGKCVYWINDERIVVSKGDFLYIPSSTAYYSKSIPTVFHEQLIFQFTVYNYVNRTDPGNNLPLLHYKRWEIIHAAVYELCIDRLRTAVKELEDQLAYAHLRCAAALLETIILLNRELDMKPAAVQTTTHIIKMKKYIEQYYKQPISKQLLGDVIDRTPNYAASLFKNHTGQTISEYVHSIRMKTALYLLENSLLSISEIADYVGYRDVSYFQRIFKRLLGASPTEYIQDRPKN